MADYEVSEVHRQPMTEVALRLKAMLSSVRRTGATIRNAAAGGEGTAALGELTEEGAGNAPDSDMDELPVEPVEPSPNAEVSAAGTVATAAHSVPDLPGVTAVLRALIEPPTLASIEDALHTLHECGMLSSPYDDSYLTEIGSLAAELPVDFMLGRFIGYAVLLGVAREAVIVAAALGNPKSLFRTPNQLLQTDVDEFNR
jgi:HrpA-like RNA helicase